MKSRIPSQPISDNPKGWIIHDELKISATIILKSGDTCRIKGEQGVFTFKRHVINTSTDPHAEWVDLFGGSVGHGQWRSVRKERVVHIPKRRKKKKPS
jgi:hypothetical protein